MTVKQWWLDILSDSDKVSTTRIILLATTLHIFILSTIAVLTDKFTAELGWFLIGLFTTICGLKGGQKVCERVKKMRTVKKKMEELEEEQNGSH